MFYYSVDSKKKVVHYEGCYRLSNIKEGNLNSFDSIKDVRKSKYRICSCCSPITEHVKKEQIELEKYCMENGLLYFVNRGNVYIRTIHSRWRILASDDRNILELHHENIRGEEDENSVPGFHRQNVYRDSILGYLQYIIEHEYYRMLNPLHIFTKKAPPKKGTRRYRAQQKSKAKKERKQAIYNVINLIDKVSARTYAV